MLRRIAPAVIFIVTSLTAATSSFDEAADLQRRGKPNEARELLRSAASQFRAASDTRAEAKALSLASQASIALGDYRTAIKEAESAAAIRRTFKDQPGIQEDFNSLGLANLYLGNYGAALTNYQQALRLDRARGSAEGEIARQNNIGNVYYFQGRYSEALRAYQAALDKVNATAGAEWNARRRQLTLANLATLYQRLGKEQTALELYQQLGRAPEAMPPGEHAQLLLNQGVLYRRLGDPVKALELYRVSQALFATERSRSGEIGALRNIGIARAVDLGDLAGALDAFTQARQLAAETSDLRGIAQSNLYRSEVLRRLGRRPEAESDAAAAFAAAQQAGLVEEQWKAQYALGKIADDGGRSDAAMSSYQKAIMTIESVRAGVRQTALRTEFLADKRDVYDSLISRLLQQPAPSVAELLSWIERSRSRTLLDRLQSREPTMPEIQARLGPNTVLLDFWVGATASATLWITNSAAGLVRHQLGNQQLEAAASRLFRSMENGDDGWKDVSRSLGSQLLAGVALRSHVIAVPDGPLSAVPIELLDESGSDLLIAKHDVSYLPAVPFLMRSSGDRKWIPPWRRQLVAFGDPPVSNLDSLAERWQPLAASADEIRGIAQLLPGASRAYLGADARKAHLLGTSIAGVPLLHFSTHAMVDEENPDRSRILLAPDSPGSGADYLFEEEVYNLDLHNVDLATVSACDTARGKLIRGEGIEAFSRAFLAAGSAATITSLWRVPDRPTADFMKQFYYFLAQGQTKAEALRSAKLQFLRSGSGLAHPRYWAAFVLNGDGWNTTRRVISWSVVAIAVALCCAVLGLTLWKIRPSATDSPTLQRTV